ncbi:MAG TPA: tetratricopeptide repeat protein [Terracidiphilus sp.]|jgi:tetratricopeptide (TPR) repeat protein
MDTNNLMQKKWTSRHALILMALCLSIGIGGGWLFRSLRNTAQVDAKSAVPAATPVAPAAQTPNQADLKSMADRQAAPLLQQLKSNPGNLDALVSIGNLYYDAQQYPAAIDFYGRALQSKPSDVSVRTDLATAYWYLGNADMAIAEFNKALAYAPNNPNTLFNLGLVKWQGKHDSDGAIADWKKLLATNPNYEAKDKVLEMLNNVEKGTTRTGGQG